jgi:large repetitive protein
MSADGKFSMIRIQMGPLRHFLIGILMAPAAVFAADPQIAEFTDTPDPVVAGGVYTYSIRVDNNAADAATNTRLTLTVPSGAAFISAAPASQNCAPVSATEVQCNLGSVGASGLDPRVITMNWRATVAGPSTITATATLTADNDINAGNNTDTEVTTVQQGANLSLVMTDSPDPAAPGGNVTYLLTAANPGPNAVGDLLVTNNLPPSSVFVSAVGAGWSCSHASGVVTCNRAGPHLVGASVPPITIVATATASSGTITNSATVSTGVGGIPDPDTADNTATANTLIFSGADLQLTSKSVTSATPIAAGSAVTFLLTPRNAGPDAGTSVVVTDVLPSGWAFGSASGSGWACSASGQTVTCTRASLAVGATDDITLIATAPAAVAEGGSGYTNTASISGAASDPLTGNNSASVGLVVVRDGADLSLSKSKTPFAATVGGALTSTLTVTNTGPRTATGTLRVVEVLTNEAYVGFGGSGWTCSAISATVVSCDNTNAGGLAVGASLPALTLNTTAVAAGSVTNTACTGSSLPSGVSGVTALPPTNPGGDPNTTNDCATANSVAVVGTGNADLRVFSVLTTTPTGGDKLISATEDSATFTTRVTNLGPADATGARVDFIIPNYVTDRTGVTPMTVSVGDAAGAPNGSTATFACTRTGASIRCSQTGGALRAADFVTFTVTASRPIGRTWGVPAVFPVQVGNTVEFDLDDANNRGQDDLFVDPMTDVEVSGKTATPATVLAGENATYVISYRNNGPDAAFDVALTDTYSFFQADGTTPNAADPGLEILSINSSRPGSSCSLAVGAIITPAANVINCTIGYMGQGEANTVTLVVRPLSQVSNPTRVVRNTAAITTTTPENATGGDNGNNSKTAALTVLSNAIDLLVNKTDSVDPVPYVPGGTFIDYRVRVTSNGPSFGTNVRINETMTPPAGKRVRFVCDTASVGGACNAPSLCTATNITSAPGVALSPFSCQVPAGNATTGPNVGELATGQTKDIFLRYEVLDQPPVSGDVFNSASTVTSDQNETFLGNNSTIEPTTTRNRIDIRVSKAPSLPTVAVAQPFNWVITVVNNGPGDSLVTDLTDTLPAGSVVTGAVTWTRTAAPDSGTCTTSGLTVACALGRLNATGSATVTVPVRLDVFPPGGVATNTATVDVDPVKTGADDFPGGNNTATAVVNVTRSSLSGTVFEDRDRAGANAGTPQAAVSEPRIAGVSLTLSGTDNLGNAVNRTTTTDASGNFTFADLPASNGAGYVLTQTQPTGFVNGPAAPPTGGGLQPSAGGTYAAGGASGDSSYAGIVLGSTVDAVNYNFPEVRRVSLSGFVYVDVNTNNVRDPASDTPLVGATVRLLNAGSLAVLQTALTDAAGFYSFTGLDPLVAYTLEEPLPVSTGSLANGPVNPGLVGGVACAAGCTAQPNTPTTGTDRIASIDLSSGLDGSQFNFGEIQVTAISGTVYVDRNLNSLLDPTPTDARLTGVTLTLYTGSSCAGTVVATQLTDASGNYSFAGLVAGQTYTVCQTQPAGYGDGGVNPGTAASSSTANAITVTGLPITGSGGNAFAERVGSVSGSVYLDANNDGTRQGGETALAGVSVTLSGTDAAGAAVNRTTTTDLSGNFGFADVVGSGAGGYTLTQQLAQPVSAGVTTLNGRTTAGSVSGSSSGTASSVATLPSTISAIALPGGAASVDNLFGEILPVRISGVVFGDADNNGVQNLPADAGLSGVTITITGTDDTGAAVNRSVTTALDGSFNVADLRPGTYTATQPTQPVGTSNGITTAGTAGGTATNVATTPSAISGIVLTSPGASSTGNLFAEVPDSGVISGRVWLDANNDGIVNGSETGIAGQTIQLSGADTRSAVTGADGSFSFTGLAPGSYVLTQPAQPAGTFNGQTIVGSAGGSATAVATTPSVISGIVLGAGQSSLNNNFGEITGGQISGRVWFDANGNGTIDGSETGIPGQTIDLTGTDIFSAPVSRSAVTAADGSYTFANLVPGTYTLTQPAQPAGTFNGSTVPGTTGGTATAVGTLPSAISALVLAAGQASANNNFGEVANGQVSGRVWIDANDNGLIDGSESGIGGVTINLSGIDTLGGAVTASTTTAADGSYSFTGLRPGSYALTQPTQPAGTFNGRTVAGSTGGTATAVAVSPSAITGISLTGLQNASLNNNFGEITGGLISGRVWTDANNNGVIDAGEIGIGGVTLTLSGTNDLGAAVSVSVVTAADGSYSFSGLRPGSYTVTQPTQPAGTLNGLTVAGSAGGTATGVPVTPSAISGVVLTAGQSSSGNNFAELGGAQISGRVWIDANNNGVIDGSEAGIAGVTLTLSGTDDLGASVSRNASTAADGSYSFSGLRPGTYAVTEPTQPSGTLNGRTVAGSTGGTATAVTTTPSAITGITLGIAQSSTANLFGEIQASQLAGRVWGDANNDGVIGTGEAGLSGVTVVLTGTNDLGAAISVAQTSGADGSFSFADLRPGTYTLTEPTQPPGTTNGATLAGTAGGAPTSVSTTPSAISSITLSSGTTATGYLFGEIPDSADLLVSKSHSRPVFTVGFTGSYTITVRNGGSLPTSGSYTVQDRLPAGLSLASTPTGAGWTCTGAVGASSFSCSSSTVIGAGATRAETIGVVVNVGAAAAAQSPVSNAVLVEGGGEVGARGPSVADRDLFLNNAAALPVCAAGVTQNVCRDPVPVQQAASVSGTVWTDSGVTLRVLDGSDRRMGGWLVEVVDPTSGSIVGRATTAANGSYRVSGLEPGVELAIRFRDPASGVVFGYPVNGETAPGSSGVTCRSGAAVGTGASSCPLSGAAPQLLVVLAPGLDLPQQSLPIDPSGVVYDSALRTAVAGARVTLAPTGSCPGYNPSTSIVAATLGGYTVAGDSISMTVGADGFYQFLLAPTAPASCNFGLTVVPPQGYAFVSTAIPPAAGPLAPAGAAGSVFAVQPQAGPPTAAPGPATLYYLALTLGSATAGVVHNHIPVDPTAIGAITLTKTGDRAVAEIGDSVRYTLTVSQAASGSRPLQTTIVDRLPAGFTYIPGTATVNGTPIADPAGGVGPTLVFNLGAMPVERQLVLRYRARIGVGAQQGDGINRAQGHACQLAAGCVDASRNPVPNASSTNAAEWRVRVQGGVFTTDACVLGKVFIDCNNNHVQDREEIGIPGVRLVLSDGTMLISDSEGKYSMCGLAPRSHVLRVDPGTLPRGARLTTSSNRNLGDAGSLWLDLKNGELHRADFIEGSCSNSVLEQTKARRAQGEVRSVESEKKGGPALRFDSKAHQLDTLRSPQQGTDGANQQAPKPRAVSPAAPSPAKDETNVPTPDLPMNQPPPRGRSSDQAPASTNAGNAASGGSHGTR